MKEDKILIVFCYPDIIDNKDKDMIQIVLNNFDKLFFSIKSTHKPVNDNAFIYVLFDYENKSYKLKINISENKFNELSNYEYKIDNSNNIGITEKNKFMYLHLLKY